jgi:hypothetical protein
VYYLISLVLSEKVIHVFIYVHIIYLFTARTLLLINNLSLDFEYNSRRSWIKSDCWGPGYLLKSWISLFSYCKANTFHNTLLTLESAITFDDDHSFWQISADANIILGRKRLMHADCSHGVRSGDDKSLMVFQQRRMGGGALTLFLVARDWCMLIVCIGWGLVMMIPWWCFRFPGSCGKYQYLENIEFLFPYSSLSDVRFFYKIIHCACLPTASRHEECRWLLFIFFIQYEYVYHLHKYWKPGNHIYICIYV